MAIIWPATLPPAPLVEGFTETLPTLTITSNMDAGPAKKRRRFTSGVVIIECSYALTREQVGILDDFYTVDTGGGALSFEWVHPRRLPAGTVVNVRFKEPPAWRPQDSVDHWKAGLTLEVLPPGMASTLDAAVAATKGLPV